MSTADATIRPADAFFEALVRAAVQRAKEELRAELAAEPKASNVSPYMTVAEAAEYLRADRQRVYDLLSARRLRKVKDGSRVLIRRVDLDAFLSD